MKSILLICTNSDLAGAPLYTLKVMEILHQKFKFITLYGTKVTNEYTQKKIKYFTKDAFFSDKLSNNFNLINDIKLILMIIKLAKKNNIDFIYLHSFKAAFIGRIASLFFNTKVIYVVHGWGWRGKNIVQKIIIYLCELLLTRFTSSYVFVSNYSLKIGKNILFINKSKIIKINSTIPFKNNDNLCIEEYRRNKRSKNINLLMIARKDSSKDHETLIKAFSKLPKIYKLQLVGKNTEEIVNYYKKFFPEDIFKRIEAFGEIRNVRDFLLNADIFVLSSIYEELPLSLIEAMSFGLPLIASKVGGCAEIISHEENGFLFKKKDFNELYKYLLNLSDNNLRNRFSKCSLKIFDEKFSDLRFEKEIFKLFKLTN